MASATNSFLMDYYTFFMNWADKAARQFAEDMLPNPFQGVPERWHAGYDLPSGGRIYFEWRAPR